MDGDGWNCLYKYLTSMIVPEWNKCQVKLWTQFVCGPPFLPDRRHGVVLMIWLFFYLDTQPLLLSVPPDSHVTIYPGWINTRTPTLVDPDLSLFSRLGCTNIHSIFHTLYMTVILPTSNLPLNLCGPVPMVTWQMADNVLEIRLNTLDVRPFRLLIQVLAPNQMYLTIHIW